MNTELNIIEGFVTKTKKSGETYLKKIEKQKEYRNIEGKLHREDGYAVEYNAKFFKEENKQLPENEMWINGVRLTKNFEYHSSDSRVMTFVNKSDPKIVYVLPVSSEFVNFFLKVTA